MRSRSCCSHLAARAVLGAPEADRKNRQREYYLNRVIPAMLAAGQKVKAVTVDSGGAMGLNSAPGWQRSRPSCANA